MDKHGFLVVTGALQKSFRTNIYRTEIIELKYNQPQISLICQTKAKAAFRNLELIEAHSVN